MHEAEENSRLNDYEIIDLIEKLDFPIFTPETRNIKDVRAFGLNKEFKNEWWFGYYIGMDYLDDNDKESAIYIKPKINNLDYLKMFQICLESKDPDIIKNIHDIYDIRIDKPFLNPPDEKNSNSFILLIMYHFLKLLTEIVKRPLVKSYIKKTENLKSKVKGKIVISDQIKKNIANRRYDKVMCTYEEYSENCPANRLLHSAYKICKNFNKSQIGKTFSFSKYKHIETRLQHIGLIESPFELSKIKTNPLFLEYKEALRLAKIIYKLQSRRENMNSSTSFIKIPPYIINMSILFELYVLYLFKKTNLEIKYQVRGKKNEKPDFLELKNHIVIDAKYKKKYDNEDYELDDIRQVSGYARDIHLLKILYNRNNILNDELIVPDCLIVYPSDKPNDLKEINEENLLSNPINDFYRFYKYGIVLPKKNN